VKSKLYKNFEKFRTLAKTEGDILVYLYFVYFWRDRVCWPLLHFVFLRDVWIRTQRASVGGANMCATNLATHLPVLHG
jgi:hypothetical protein